jgi:hypothetical protein
MFFKIKSDGLKNQWCVQNKKGERLDYVTVIFTKNKEV